MEVETKPMAGGLVARIEANYFGFSFYFFLFPNMAGIEQSFSLLKSPKSQDYSHDSLLS